MQYKKRVSPRDKNKDPDLHPVHKNVQEAPPDPADEARNKKILWPDQETAQEKNRESWEGRNEKI